MRRALGWLARLLSPVRSLRTDEEIAAELESHIALHMDDKLQSGMTLEEARSDAWRKLGAWNVRRMNTAISEECP